MKGRGTQARSTRKGTWIVAAALLGGCLSPAGPKAPGEGGQAWLEVDSSHFRLITDLDAAGAGRVVGGLEETYGLLGRAIFNGEAAPAFRTNAIIFEQGSDLRQFIGDWGGRFVSMLPNDVEPSPTLLAYGTLSPFARLLFAHELTHRFNYVALGPTPVWLNEGLADYYETIRSEAGAPVLGEIDPRYQCTPDGLGNLQCWQDETLPGSRLPKASNIVAMSWDDFYAGVSETAGAASFKQNQERLQNYGVAWLLVHMLMSGHMPYAERFRDQLAAPSSPRKGEALSRIVREVPADQLDRDLSEYLRHGMPWRQHHASPTAPPAGVEQRALRGTEVQVWWARLTPFRGDSAARAHSLLESAAKARREGDGEPLFWLGRYQQLQGDLSAAEDEYKSALREEPNNPEYLYGLLRLYWASDGARWLEEARTPRVEQVIDQLGRSARSPAQLNAVAAHQVLSGKLEAALKTSAEACRVGPDCWPCFHNRAAALFNAGKVALAADTELEALNRVPETVARNAVQMLSRALAFYRAAKNDPTSVQANQFPPLVAP